VVSEQVFLPVEVSEKADFGGVVGEFIEDMKC
jgi:hypothetical protein